MERTLALALATFTAGAPAKRAWIWRVDARGIPVPDETVVLLASGRQPRTPENAASEYLGHYWRDDPFSPHRFLDRRRSVVTLAEIGGPKALTSTAYGREFLPESGFSHRVFVHVWHEGRLAGVAALMRTPDQPAFRGSEVRFLRRVQPLVAMAYAYASTPTISLEREHILQANGLRPRQIEVARLAAGGSTNAEIGRALMISAETVKRHLSTTYARLGVRSRTELSVKLGAFR